MRRRFAFLSVLALAVGYSLGFVDGGKRAQAEPEPLGLFAEIGRVMAKTEAAYVDPVSRKKLIEGALSGMIGGLDPHSSYMNREEYAAFLDDSAGRFAGVGVEVDIRADGIVLVGVIEGSPAEKSGLRGGDRLLAVDGESLGDSSPSALLRKLRGAPGTAVTVVIQREGELEPRTVKLVRAQITVASVQVLLLEEDVLYIRIKQFQEGTHAELRAQLARLNPQTGAKPKAILLDLRSNPGGLVDEAVAIADEFLDAGTVYSLRNRGQTVERAVAEKGGALLSAPLLVLVNEWSASASELLAGALQDNKRGQVAGAQTFGKGSVQTIFDLPAGSGLKITTGRYYTPNGTAIQGEGVHPDRPIVGTKGQAGVKSSERGLRGSLSAETQPQEPARKSQKPVMVDAKPGDYVVLRLTERDPRKVSDPVLKAALEMLLKP
jgi:carboxyl-terminal processing protease